MRERLEFKKDLEKRFGFNSRSREGATTSVVFDLTVPSVSIHAPVRERLARKSRERLWPVSIHAPVRERLQDLGVANRQLAVSIHAPVRERLLRFVHFSKAARFNSRSREGAT